MEEVLLLQELQSSSFGTKEPIVCLQQVPLYTAKINVAFFLDLAEKRIILQNVSWTQ